MRADSTLIERYIEAFFAKQPEERHAVAEESYANALREVAPGHFKEESHHWFINLQEKDNGPEVTSKRLETASNYWESTPCNGGDPVWRVRLERERFVLNFRKHLVADPGTKEEFFAFALPNLKMLRQYFGLTTWKNFRLTYFFRFDNSHIDDTSLAKPNRIEVKNIFQFFDLMPTVDGFNQYVHPCNIKLLWEQSNAGNSVHSGIKIDSNITQSSKSLDVKLFSESCQMCEAKLGDDAILGHLTDVVHANYKNSMTDKMHSVCGKDLQ